jgi:hypothetical protein
MSATVDPSVAYFISISGVPLCNRQQSRVGPSGSYRPQTLRFGSATAGQGLLRKNSSPRRINRCHFNFSRLRPPQLVGFEYLTIHRRHLSGLGYLGVWAPSWILRLMRSRTRTIETADPVSGARCATGLHRVVTDGCARAATPGTLSTLGASVRCVCFSGHPRSAWPVVGGRLTPFGTNSSRRLPASRELIP